MRGIILAWMLGEGIIVFRSVTKNHAPPVPGTLLATSGLFILLAVIAEYDPAKGAATAFAFGVDIAALLNLWGLGGSPKQQAGGAPAAQKGKTAPAGLA